MLGPKLLKRCLPIIIPVDFPAPRNPEELAEQELQRLNDLRHLPALQTLVSADRLQVRNDIIDPMVAKLSALPRLAILLDTHHVPSCRRGYNAILVEHSEVPVPET